MRVTLFSDAGMCPSTRVASWGVWARNERGILRQGGIFKNPICAPGHGPDVILAETAAAINGIAVGLSTKLILPNDHVLIQTDNQVVGNVLTGWKPKGLARDRRPYYEMLAEHFARLLAEHSLTHEWRHVKGHKGTASPRNAVNTYADQVATFYLKLGRHQKNPTRYPPPIWIPPLLPVKEEIVQLVAVAKAEHEAKVAERMKRREWNRKIRAHVAEMQRIREENPIRELGPEEGARTLRAAADILRKAGFTEEADKLAAGLPRSDDSPPWVV